MDARGFRESVKKPWKNIFRDRRAASSAPSLTQPREEVQSPKNGDAEHGTKASSNTTGPHSSSNPPVVDARAARYSTDVAAKDLHQPATASQVPPPALPVEPTGEPPAAESTEKQPAALSTSQRLWSTTYDSLKKDDDAAELVRSYVKTLTKVLGAGSEISSGADVTTELEDPTKRQMFMKKLVDEGRAKVVKASKITRGVGDFIDAILSVKPTIDSAIKDVPQAAPAALPWAGVCVGLQILSNPAKAMRSNLAGIMHVISRMDWYCALTEHLLNEDSIEIGHESYEAVLRQLEEKVVALYKALLLYQMRSVCSYYRHQGLVFLRGLANWDDWDADLKTVTDAENTLQRDLDQYNKLHAKSVFAQLAKHAEGLLGLLGDVRQDIRQFIDQHKAMQMDDKDKKCLQDLYVVDPQDDMEKIEKNKDTLLEEAYKWILDTKEYAAFTNWSNAGSALSSCRLMWVKDHAGTGKTMLLMGIIRELSSQPATLAPNVSHFFCQGTDKALNNATATLRSLVWLLLVQQPHLISHLRSKHENAGSSLFEGTGAFITLSNAFKSILKDPDLFPVYFIIDALDECEQGLADLIELILTSLTLSDKVKWLVSSRPSVELGTPDTAGSVVELDTAKLKDPVNAYINHKLSAFIGKPGYTKQVLDDVSAEVLKRAENTFLWIWFVFKDLGKTNKFGKLLLNGRDAPRKITEFPLGLSRLYGRIMDIIDSDQVGYPQYCKDVLAAATLALRPLTLSELAVLADLPLDMPQTIVEDCGSFLTTKEETVYLIHQSAKDYLDENFASRLQPAGVSQGHADIGRRSIDAMSSVLKQNMYNLSFGFKPENMTPPDPDPLGPIRYSCVFWADHLCFRNGESPECTRALADDGAVFTFLKERFVRWLESLSLLRKLSDGALSIRKLLHIVRESGVSPQLTGFLRDTEKFILSHGSIIERAPLQAYGSALVFSPAMSEVKGAQWKERLSFIKTVAGIRDRWGAHQQTLEGHSGGVSAVAFSPDGKILASASDDRTVRLWDAATGTHQQTLEGHSGDISAVTLSPVSKTLASASHDGTIRLWDAATGAHQQTLEGHSYHVSSIAFSPDGKTLASASDDRTVRLWDAATGAHRQSLEGHAGGVRAVTFSPDGKTLASASHDRTVRLWDAAIGAHQQTLEGHGGDVRAVAFSPDGKTLVSASRDRTVRLWDTATGAHQQMLEGHSYYVSAIAFSPDSKTLASASGDRTVRLWDAATGAHQRTLEGHVGGVKAVAFSPDGRTLASASDDRTVRLWDAATGAHQQTLEGHGGCVRAVAFSPDGKILASASDDRTVRLWDAATGTHQQTLEGHSHWVSAVAFSPDGKTLASASGDDTVRLWDIATGAHEQTLEGHSHRVSAVAFSPDGKTLASASRDGTVRLWDAAMGAHQQTLEGHGDCVRAVAFSPDGRTLASASVDRTVRLWDTATGAHQQTLEGHSHWVRAVAFSPDGKTLASASRDGTVRLWDVATGAHQQTLQIDRSITTLTFSESGQYLQTNYGSLRISPEPTSSNTSRQNLSDRALSVNDEWVTLDANNLLWLPSDYRATATAVAGSTAVLGHRSGGLTFLQFEFS